MANRKLRLRHSALGRTVARFGADRRGATAATIAISMAVLAPMALGVVDVYVASEQKGKLQDALDAATLSAARSTAQTDAEIDAIGDKALQANLALIPNARLTASDFRLVDTKVVATAAVSLPSMGPIFNQGAVSVSSEVQRAGKIEVALVLDNTGSMAGQKLTSLKSAAKSLVDKLVTASQHSTDADPLKISLVPFSSTVRVQGTTSLTGSNYTTTSHTGPSIPTWIDPFGMAHRSSGSTYDIFDVPTDRLAVMKTIGQSWNGCVEARTAPYDVQETAPNSVAPETMFVPYFWPDEPNTSNAMSNAINDYMNDGSSAAWKTREQRSAKYTSANWRNQGSSFMSGYTAGPNAGCALQPMIRLTRDTAAIKTGISNMTAVGDTNIPIGLMWGWHVLSPNAPLSDGAAYETQDLRKVIVLMTDGDNTFTSRSDNNKSYYSGWGYIWQKMISTIDGSSSTSQRTAAMDARLKQLCANVKARKILVYTVRVEVTTGSSDLLKGCASSPDMFYDVQNSSQLGTAFDAIANSIANLRISK